MAENIERRKVTESLVVEKKSDYARWSDSTSLMPAWDQRTQKISEFIEQDTSVFEFGAGAGALKGALPQRCKYVKSDIVSRDQDTVIIDLNDAELKPLPTYDYAVFSGVLEYIHDLPKVIAFLANSFDYVVCSYAITDTNAENRRDHGWVNDLSLTDFVQVFKQAGYLLLDSIEWKTQLIFKFKRKTTNSNHHLDFIDHTFVITLDDATDRQTHIKSEFLALGLKNFSFFNATNFDDKCVIQLCASKYVAKFPACFRCGKEDCCCANNVLIPKQIANWWSFLRVLRTVASGNLATAMICEDDVKFTYYADAFFAYCSTQNTLIKELHSDTPTLIRLGYPGIREDLHKYNGAFSLTDTTQMSNSCFICNAAYAKFVLKKLNSAGVIDHTSDVFFHKIVIDETVNAHTVKPPPAFDLSQSQLVYSSIHPKQVNQMDLKRQRTHVKKINRNIGFSHVFGGNFGDLIGPYLFKCLTGIEPKQVAINDPNIRDAIDFEHYLLVGSILKHVGSHSVLWGIGIMDPTDVEKIEDKINPNQVYAVRGPKTLQAFKDAGLTLPNDVVFGDPGLLMPVVYPKVTKPRYRFGIIPHFTEYEQVLSRYQDHPDTIVICLGNHKTYGAITATIDALAECERILSSSLHGIVLAHAYKIPCAWCQFTEITVNGKMGTNALKFQDYFESVDMIDAQPQVCTSVHPQFPALSEFSIAPEARIKKIQYELLTHCPFNIYGFRSVEEFQNFGVLKQDQSQNLLDLEIN